MQIPIIGLSLIAATGVVIGYVLNSPDQSPTTPSVTADVATPGSAVKANIQDYLALSNQLQEEIEARKELEKQIASIKKQLDSISQQGQPGADQSTTSLTESTLAESPHRDNGNSSGSNTTWFNTQALTDAGMDEIEARRLKSQFEKMELEKLYLRDRAIREGWSDSPRFQEELQQIEAQAGDLKNELGEDMYAAYLYATGQPNRVAVQSILASSTADTAGIQAGDQILQYGDQRIYNWLDLRQATTQGVANETVTVKVLRDDELLQFNVTRGPLGIRMTSLSVNP